jgi:hypothetical protein
MELVNSPRSSRVASVNPACNFGVWDVSEVESIMFDLIDVSVAVRREELGVRKIVDAPKPLKKFTSEFLVAVSVTQSSIIQATNNRLCHSFGARLLICLDLEGGSIGRHVWFYCDRSALSAWELEQTNLYLPWTAEEDSAFYRLARMVGFHG